jgi:hypothetical protein
MAASSMDNNTEVVYGAPLETAALSRQDRRIPAVFSATMTIRRRPPPTNTCTEYPNSCSGWRVAIRWHLLLFSRETMPVLVTLNPQLRHASRSTWSMPVSVATTSWSAREQDLTLARDITEWDTV